MTDLIKTKMDLVFRQVEKLTSSHWNCENVSIYNNDIDYFSYIKGQKIGIRIMNLGKNKVKALLSIGVRSVDNHCIYKSIAFSILKSENAIFNDLCKRLEISELTSKVDKILLDRVAKQERLDEFKHKVDIFKRFLPFERGYKGLYHLYANCKGKRIDVEIGGRGSIRIEADDDFLMKVCACVSELIEKSN